MTKPPAVIGLDPSLASTGVAAIRHGQPSTIAAITNIGYSGTDADGYPERRLRIRSQMHAIARTIAQIGAEHRIVLCAIEGPIYGMRGLPSYFDRAGLWVGLCDWIDVQRIPIAVIAPGTREKFITGVGTKGDKPRVLAEMRAFWCPDADPADAKRAVRNHDQADALGLATMAAVHLGWPLPSPLGRRHTEGVLTPTWPRVVA